MQMYLRLRRRQWQPTPVPLAWKTPWAGEPGRLQSMGSLQSDTTEQLHFHFSLSCIGEGNGNPLQCSCLQNPRDGGAWWAAISGVAQSRTQLKQLSSSSKKSSTQIKGRSGFICMKEIISISLCPNNKIIRPVTPALSLLSYEIFFFTFYYILQGNCLY